MKHSPNRKTYLPMIASLLLFSSVAYAQVPDAPTITSPVPDASIQTNRPDLVWTGPAHDMYEVHINTTNDPAGTNGWNSGQVASSANKATSGPLLAQTTYYVFVRLHNASGWGAWSTANRYFYTNAEWLSDPILITDQGGEQRDHAIAFNSERNEYMVTYMDKKPADPLYYIGGWRINGSGVKQGSEIRVNNFGVSAGATMVAYGSGPDEYVVSYRNDAALLYGQRINAINSALVGSRFDIMTSNATYEHAISYSSTSNCYLEVWRDEGGGPCTSVLARRVSATGTLLGSNITVVNGVGCVGLPKIAYNSTADEFLVSWQRDNAGQSDLYARRVRASDGVLMNSAVLMAGTGYWEIHAGMAYDSNMNRYLIAYESLGGDPNSVWGQFVDAAGNLNGARFPIAFDPYNGGLVSCTWNSVTKEYLVAWISGVSNENYARRISQTGVVIGDPFRTNGTVGGSINLDPIVAANSVNNDYMVSWMNDYIDVYVRRYKTYTPFNFPASVSIDLGTTDFQNRMTAPIGGDGDTVAASIGGRNCKRNMDPSFNDAYFYFTVSDNFAFQGSKPQVSISVDYYDTGTTTLALQYDSTSAPYTNGPVITLTNTNTWKTAVLNINDAYFGNRQNHGSDFRIYTGGAVTRYIDFVKVAVNTVALPGLATNPNPANGATGVSITASLSWTAGSGATSHDVRFGTTNPPPFIQNQAGTTYNPGTMAAGTTYFWRIDEKNSGGTTTGTVWSFTTLPLPGLASAPNPANAATGVSITPTLSWTAGSNTTSHDVRFGTANPPPFIQNQAGVTYNPGALIGNTTYFWRIDEKNGSGTTTGTVWNFTTTFCYKDSFAYANGNLNGNGGWSGSAASEIQIVSQTVKINGGAVSKDSLHTTSCGASGTGLIQVAVKVQAGTGTTTMWSLWLDDPAAINICRWYGTGTTARGRIGSTGIVTTEYTLTGGWDNLLVKINPTAKTAEFFLNGTSMGVLSFSGQGAANTLGRIRFERINNSGAAGHFLSFDDLVVY